MRRCRALRMRAGRLGDVRVGSAGGHARRSSRGARAPGEGRALDAAELSTRAAPPAWRSEVERCAN
eukprot:3410078-Prymnesium_polylepis.1